jgi:hypothetical protein
MSTCSRPGRRLAGIAAISTLVLSTFVPSAESAGAISPPAILLAGNPGMLAINTVTDTVYVPIQTGGVEVVNGARCSARASEGCNPVATIPTADSLAAAIDAGTDTVYVVSGNDVWVVDGAHCNGTVTAGCRRQVGTIKTPGNVEALSLDLETATLYMASLNGAIYVADVAKCNRMTTEGCSAPTETIDDPYIPVALSVDTRTDTIYAANNGYCPGTTEDTTCSSGTGHTVSVIDGGACNASVSAGCGRKPALITVGSGANWTELDEGTDTLYVDNILAGTVSVIDTARCNSHVTSSCRPAGVINTGAGASYSVVDQTLHTLFTLNSGPDTLTETNVTTCNGKVTSGCATVRGRQAAPTLGEYANPTPNNAVLDVNNGTLYVTCTGGSVFITVVNVGH